MVLEKTDNQHLKINQLSKNNLIQNFKAFYYNHTLNTIIL